MPSAHCGQFAQFLDLGMVGGASSTSGRPEGLNMRVSPPARAGCGGFLGGQRLNGRSRSEP
jgi:hypothetical protein